MRSSDRAFARDLVDRAAVAFLDDFARAFFAVPAFLAVFFAFVLRPDPADFAEPDFFAVVFFPAVDRVLRAVDFFFDLDFVFVAAISDVPSSHRYRLFGAW